jgi:hypothetical protein
MTELERYEQLLLETYESIRKEYEKAARPIINRLAEVAAMQPPRPILMPIPTKIRLTPDDIDAAIVGEDYYLFPGTTTTVCCLKLRNGYTVIGESATVSPETFDPLIGKQIARGHARDKIWELEGYLLKEQLFNANQPAT